MSNSKDRIDTLIRYTCTDQHFIPNYSAYSSMANIWIRTLLLGVCFCVLIDQSAGWFTSLNCKSKRSHDDEPYHFGHTDLKCLFDTTIVRAKRSAPWRFPYALKHGWIYYKGHYFEFGVDVSNTGTFEHSVSAGHPYKGNKCAHEREAVAAGFSRLSVDCLKKCSRSYTKEYGEYNLFSNNCNMFANRISKILCSSRCPAWCK